MESNISLEEMQSVLDKMNQMWGVKDFSGANDLFNKYIDKDINDKAEILFKANLCGRLTDVCDLAKTESLEGHISDELENSLEKVVEYLAANLPQVQKVFKQGDANYNYATSLSTLYSFKRIKNSDYLLPVNAELLIKAKKQFWIAIRASNGEAKLEMMVNLAHVLSDCHRITECLYLYDKVIEEQADFPQANYSKAKSLEYLNELTSGYTINLLYEVFNHYKVASESEGDCHPSLKEDAKSKRENVKELLSEHGYSELNITEDRAKSLQEFSSHSKKRQFYIKNGLALSEHSLYCGCNGAARDNLTILKSSAHMGGEFVPRLEHVLNQLKSEYFKARELFYNSQFKADDKYKNDNYELCLTDLGDFEINGLRAEDLRLAFKACYSVLDKIALSVCEHFGFAVDKSEKVYFESFWRKQQMRWEEINAIENSPSLFALYFQSTDLDSKKGEWKDFKKWRNAMEHGYFVLISGENSTAPYGILDRHFRVVHVEYDLFKDRTAELLRFVRSAIFNFTFCIRQEADKVSLADNLISATPVVFEKKDFP